MLKSRFLSIPLFRISVPAFIVMMLIILTVGCKTNMKPDEMQRDPEDTTQLSSATENMNAENAETQANDTAYGGIANDDVKISMETFSPIVEVLALAHRAISFKDSLEAVSGVRDSMLFQPYDDRAYEAILKYKNLMKKRKSLHDNCPDLLQLSRLPNPKTADKLPDTRSSEFFSQGKFFFLGGAPFIYRVQNDDHTSFTNDEGKPETRFNCSISENAPFLLNSIYHFKSIPIDVTYGPALSYSDTEPQEVRGIGSLIHNFVKRIPAVFFTDDGLVSAELVCISKSLSPNNSNCMSNESYIQFACSKSIDEKEILGIYIPYNSAPFTSCNVRQESNSVWTVDINNDNIADIACVSDPRVGEVSDTITESTWFVNLNGKWTIIDWAIEPDCT